VPVAVAAPGTPAPEGPPPAMRNVALVGLGVAGVIGGLVLVLAIAAGLVTAVLAPLIVIRIRSRG
jgi:hypothetical protein